MKQKNKSVKNGNNRRERERDNNRKDYAILSLIQEDCTLTAEQLSNSLKSSGYDLGSGACMNRKKSLIEDGFIVKQCAVLDHRKFGLSHLCFMIVNVRDKSDVKMTSEFLEEAKQQKSILEIHTINGLCDYLLKVRVENTDEATEISQTLQQRFKSVEIQTYTAGSRPIKETSSLNIKIT